MSDENEFICALSGKSAAASALVEDAPADDGLGALPLDWIEVTVRRRAPNPTWEALQGRKARLIENAWAGLAAQLPPELPDEEKTEMKADITMSIAVQFAYIESQVERYQTDEITVYVNAADPSVSKEWVKIADALGVADPE